MIIIHRAKSTIIGDIGESKAIFEFTRYGIPVLVPMSDNLPYDLVIDCNGKFLRVQVKTCKSLKEDGRLYFEICRNNAFTGEHWNYTDKEVDLFFFYCVELDIYALVTLSDLVNCKRGVTFRKDDYIPANNQSKGIRYISDYSIEKTFSRLGYVISLE